MAFNDVALLTATANDVAFEEVFALPLRRVARAGDLLTVISSSGNSPNILRAIDAAREMSLTVVTLTGMSADNRARAQGDGFDVMTSAEASAWADVIMVLAPERF